MAEEEAEFLQSRGEGVLGESHCEEDNQKKKALFLQTLKLNYFSCWLEGKPTMAFGSKQWLKLQSRP